MSPNPVEEERQDRRNSSNATTSPSNSIDPNSESQIESEELNNIDVQNNIVHIEANQSNLQIVIHNQTSEEGSRMTSSIQQSIRGSGDFNWTVPTPSPRSRTRENQFEENISHSENIEKFLKSKILKINLTFHGCEVSSEDVPVVHPRIFKIPFFETFFQDLENDSSARNLEINFKNLLHEANHHRFITLVGFPGSGKTTCSRRLANQGRDLGFVCFYLSFLNMNYGNDKLTLKELLLCNFSAEMPTEVWDKTFDWIVLNQKKIILILDGLDQSDWSFPKNSCPPRSIERPQLIQNLVANLICKHFLPEATIILTTRPHSLLAIPNYLRPNATFMLGDLSLSDTKKIFFALCGSKASRAWTLLKTSAPQLISICLCPLILNLYIRAVLGSWPNIENINTTTRIFNAVLEKLSRSDNTRNDDIKKILPRLTKLAFHATSQGTELIFLEQLQKFNLDVETVQDLVVLIQNYEEGFCKILEKEKKLYFCHQTFQEHFTALYIAKQMSIRKFKKLVKIIFCEEWSVVRQFIFGILFDCSFYEQIETLQSRDFRTIFTKRENTMNVINKKRLILEKALIKRMTTKRSFPGVGYGIIDLSADLREGNCEELTEKVSSRFSKICLMDLPTFSSSNAHSLSLIIRKIPSSMKELQLCGCNLDTDGFEHICDAIMEMPGQIATMDISENKLLDIKRICSILHKIEFKLLMEYCLVTPDGTTRCATESERSLLQDALNNSHNTV